MKNISFALLLVLTSSVTAFAGTATTFVEVNSGTFNDPSLTGFSTWAMRITADTDWTNNDLDISLSSGTINHYLKPGSFLGGPTPTEEPTGAVLGDTAVFGPLYLLGDFSGGIPPTSPVPTTLVESPTSFAVSWFNTNTTDFGVFDIAMITISDDANGELSFRTIAGTAVEDGGIGIGAADIFEIVNGQIVAINSVPEPGSIALAAFGLIGVMGTRRRRNG